jgi:hypothetical protein
MLEGSLLFVICQQFLALSAIFSSFSHFQLKMDENAGR